MVEPERKPVEVVSADGRVSKAEFTLWEISPTNENMVRLVLSTGDKVFTADADSYFDALILIRHDLEEIGLRPKCVGASLNVYPSGMSRSMGTGDKAYRLTLGLQAKMRDLVDIFDVDPMRDPVSVADQEKFYDEWLNSLK